ncbi:hypothetical protein RCL1_000146 [Eukaryota sp. TZLM3-RCL]
MRFDAFLRSIYNHLSIHDVVRLFQVSNYFHGLGRNYLSTSTILELNEPINSLTPALAHFIERNCRSLTTLRLGYSREILFNPPTHDLSACKISNQTFVTENEFKNKRYQLAGLFMCPKTCYFFGSIRDMFPIFTQPIWNLILELDIIISPDEVLSFADISALCPGLVHLTVVGQILNDEPSFALLMTTVSTIPLKTLGFHSELDDSQLIVFAKEASSLVTLRHLKLLSHRPLMVNEHVPVHIARSLRTLITNKLSVGLMANCHKLEQLSLSSIGTIVMTELLKIRPLSCIRAPLDNECLSMLLSSRGITPDFSWTALNEVCIHAPLRYTSGPLDFDQVLLQRFLSSQRFLSALTLVDCATDLSLSQLAAHNLQLKNICIIFRSSTVGYSSVSMRGINSMMECNKLKKLSLQGLRFVHRPHSFNKVLDNLTYIHLFNCTNPFSLLRTIELSLGNLTSLYIRECIGEEIDGQMSDTLLQLRTLKHLVIEEARVTDEVNFTALKDKLQSLPVIVECIVSQPEEEQHLYAGIGLL